MSRLSGAWPAVRLRTLDWLARESRRERPIDALIAGVGARLLEDGLPLARVTLQLRTLHPQFYGARLLWRTGMERVYRIRGMDAPRRRRRPCCLAGAGTP